MNIKDEAKAVLAELMNEFKRDAVHMPEKRVRQLAIMLGLITVTSPSSELLRKGISDAIFLSYNMGYVDGGGCVDGGSRNERVLEKLRRFFTKRATEKR